MVKRFKSVLRTICGCAPALGACLLVAISAHTAAAQTNVYVSNSNTTPPKVTVIDGVTNAVLTTIPIPSTNAGALAFTPDGSRLYVTTGDVPGSVDIAVIDTAPASPTYNQVVTTIAINATIGATTFTTAHTIFIGPGGKFAYFRFFDKIGVLDIDAASPTFHQVVGAVTGITIPPENEAAFTPDGKEMWLILAGGFGFPSGLAVINTDPSSPGFNTATQLSIFSGFNPQGISITPDGAKVFVSGWGSNRIRVFDRVSRAFVTDIFGGQGFAPRGNAVTPDGKKLLAVTDGQTVVREYNAITNTFVNGVVLDFTSNGVHFIRTSVNGARAYVSGSNVNFVRVLDLTTSPPAPFTNVTVGPVPVFLAVQPADSTPPVITLVGDSVITVECGSAFTDPGATATDDRDGNITASIAISGTVDTSTVGTYQVRYNVSDAAGNAAPEVVRTVQVVDTTPPEIMGASVDKAVLSPPNHKLIDVTVNYTTTDNCSAPAMIVSTLSVAKQDLGREEEDDDDDDDDGHGKKNEPDWVIVDAHHVKLRAERLGDSDGRLYLITITSTDQAGNSATKVVTVFVPKDRGKG